MSRQSPTEAAKRLMNTANNPLSFPGSSLSDQELADIRTVCEAVQAMPRWQERPTVPGCYVICFKHKKARDVRTIGQDDINDWHGYWPNASCVFGPIPGKRQGASMNWQPIETAPKDGTPILIWQPDEDDGTAPQDDMRYAIGYWRVEDEWLFGVGSWGNRNSATVSPTHWIPLPLPPQPEGGVE